MTAGLSARIRCLAIDPEEKRFAVGGTDGSVWILGSETGETIHKLKQEDFHREPVLSVAFSADGKRLASASGDTDPGGFFASEIGTGEVKVWDTSNWTKICGMRADTGPIFGVAFNFEAFIGVSPRLL